MVSRAAAETRVEIPAPTVWLRIGVVLTFVFLSGFANLATQIIGPRMFSSFLGADTLVWATMISVTLVGLSIGYVLGGRIPLATVKRVLPLILAANAVYLVVISGLIWQIPAELGGFGVFSVLALTFAIFFVPATLFGTISPASITLLSEVVEREQMSRVTGAVYGVGTVGNVVGALTAAFVLIPYVGLSLSFQVFGVVMLLFAAYFWLTGRGATEPALPVREATPAARLRDVPLDARSLLLLALVFFSGFGSLATEIIAPRMFTSMFGPTTILWAIMISVTLFGLSVGYVIGGNIPLRAGKYVLPVVITLNAMLLLAASWIVWEFPTTIDTINVNAVIQTALAAFLLPSILFGIDSQIVIAMLAEGKDKAAVSRIVGIVFGVTTIGSVLGALAAALVLIPYVGFSLSLQGFTLGFLLFALVLFPGGTRALAVAGLGALIFVPQPDWEWNEPSLTLLEQREGYYQTIRIYSDETSFVRLHLGPTYESEMDLNTFEPRFGYARNMVDAVDAPQGANVLVIGGAGHSMARALEARGATVTEVEIDPIVVEVSDEFFGPIEGEVHVEDGRAFVERADADTYDYVLIDAFNGPASIPPQLTTVEFFEAVERILTPDGLMVMNFIGYTTGDRSGSFAAVAATIAEAFTDARYFGTGGNILFMASETNAQRPNLPQAPADGQVLTDDLNPIEILLEEARRGLRYRH